MDSTPPTIEPSAPARGHDAGRSGTGRAAASAAPAPPDRAPVPARPDALPEALPREMVEDIRSDHAGETGAVRIYQGILAVSRDPGVRAFATKHLATERHHLELLRGCFPEHLKSRLLPLWNVAGWVTGALPALLGPRAVYATIDAVETFVDHHYQAQLDRIDALRAGAGAGTGCAVTLDRWRALIRYCQADEISHRDEARAARTAPLPAWLGLWQRLIAIGSAVAVRFARVI
jgi:ubiquinone biosynthesis monooxygenase Coq7